MTATNLFVQRSRVSLITDGAFYDEEGRIMHIGTKVAFSRPCRMALAVSGEIQTGELVDALAGAATQTEAMEALPPAVARLSATRAFQVLVAIWSDVTDRPEGWLIATQQGYLGPGYRPGTLVGIETVSSPPLRKPVNLRTFDTYRDGRKVLLQQRRAPDIDGRFYVGGFGELTVVDREGVRQERLVTWTDRVGDRIAA